MRNTTFTPDAMNDLQYWILHDSATAKRILELINDIQRNGFAAGIGKPEPLKGRKEFSRRITQEHRLIYTGDETSILIVSCRGHY